MTSLRPPEPLKASKLQKVEPGLGRLGQVGLRSLVLKLDRVGSSLNFSRPGGEAKLALRLVRQDAIVSAGLALALGSFLLCLLGAWRGTFSGLTLVALGSYLLWRLRYKRVAVVAIFILFMVYYGILVYHTYAFSSFVYPEETIEEAVPSPDQLRKKFKRGR